MECAYVDSDVTEAKFFATPVLLGKNGLEKNLGLGKLNDFEKGSCKALVCGRGSWVRFPVIENDFSRPNSAFALKQQHCENIT